MVTVLIWCFQGEPQTKAEKVKLALEKLKEAKVRKVRIFLWEFGLRAAAQAQSQPASRPQLIIKVLMSDGSSKALTVDERQTVREVLDKLFEKTHCNRDIDWSLCESNPELQTGETGVHARWTNSPTEAGYEAARRLKGQNHKCIFFFLPAVLFNYL